jgi:uncharacterized protein YebE (UPF0316 family)
MVTALFAGPWGPLAIFALRIIDVSLATLRTLLTIRGARVAVPLLGFVESLIWVLAVGTAIRHLNSPLHVLGYAGGFATGTAVGLWLEEKLALGLATFHIVSRQEGEVIAAALRERGFGVTEFLGQGREGHVEVVNTVVLRRHIRDVLALVDKSDPDAFVSVEEPRTVRRGWMFDDRRK